MCRERFTIGRGLQRKAAMPLKRNCFTPGTLDWSLVCALAMP